MTVFEDHIQLEYALDKEYKFLTKVMAAGVVAELSHFGLLAVCIQVVYPRGELDKMRKVLSKEDCHRIFCHIALIEGAQFAIRR